VNEELYHKIVEQLENGRVGTCEYALRVCAEPEIKVTKSTLSRTTMVIGDIQTRMDDAISIPVRTGKATAIVRPQSFKKFSRRNGSGRYDTRLDKSLGGLGDKLSNGAMSAPWEDIAPLAMRTEFVLAPQSKENEDGAAENENGDREDASEHFQDQQRVEKEDLTKSYKYGSTWIPIEDLSENYLPTQQGLELVGFSYEDMVCVLIISPLCRSMG
jgi:ATP-dependent DNA helicase 2 subunit 2